MSVISAAAMQTMTDQIAAKIQAALTGFANESTLKTVPWLSDQLAAGAGSDANAALATNFLATDRAGYPEQYNAQIATLFGRQDLINDVQSLGAYVKTPTGGSYASFSAYVKDKAPTLHPLFGELMRVKGGDSLVDPAASTSPVGVFAPAYQAAYAAQVLTGVDGALVDRTAALSGGAGTITCFAANTNSVYIRSRAPFSRAIFGLSTLSSASITPTFFYWNGTSYTAVPTIADNTAGLQSNDTLALTPPSDWEPNYKDAGGTVFPNNQERLYTLQIKRGNAAGLTPPVATCLTVAGSLQVSATGYHLPVPQPPLALLRITAANSVTVDWLVNPDTVRFVPPAIRLRALSALGATLTLTVSYTNQAGATQTQVQGGWASPAALATTPVTLNGADTGVKAILTSGWLASVTASGLGIVAVEVAPVRSPAI